MRALMVPVSFVVYTALMLAWLLAVGHVAALEQDIGPRFVRLSGWPTRVMLVGLAWTLLLVASVVVALRARARARPLTLAALTATVSVVTTFVPPWFRGLGYFGPSTSEFLDAMFMLLGGILPGGQASIGLWITITVLAVMTIASLRSGLRGGSRN